MLNCRIYIKNESNFCDENAFVDIKLPAIPRVGDRLYLGRDYKNQLCEQVIKTTNAAILYSDYFYGPDVTRDIDLDDAICVVTVAFDSDSEVVHIELSAD